VSDTTIQSKDVKTRKPHRCVFCWSGIPVGELANYWCGVYDGEFQSNHAHQECLQAWLDDGAEEFTPGDYPAPERIRLALAAPPETGGQTE
jgi:hypothetical protein